MSPLFLRNQLVNTVLHLKCFIFSDIFCCGPPLARTFLSMAECPDYRAQLKTINMSQIQDKSEKLCWYTNSIKHLTLVVDILGTTYPWYSTFPTLKFQSDFLSRFWIMAWKKNTWQRNTLLPLWTLDCYRIQISTLLLVKLLGYFDK